MQNPVKLAMKKKIDSMISINPNRPLTGPNMTNATRTAATTNRAIRSIKFIFFLDLIIRGWYN